MHIRDWPANERPRERLLAHGPERLSDAELLAVFLGSGLRGTDAVGSARALLARHGSLRALLELSTEKLIAEPGLGPARVCALKAALELGSRHLAAGLERGEALTDPSRAGEYFARRLRGLPHEVFAALFLDLCLATAYVHNSPAFAEPACAAEALLHITKTSSGLVDKKQMKVRSAFGRCTYGDMSVAIQAMCLGPPRTDGGNTVPAHLGSPG